MNVMNNETNIYKRFMHVTTILSHQINDPSSTYYKIGQIVNTQDTRVNSDAAGVAGVLNKNIAFIKVWENHFGNEQT